MITLNTDKGLVRVDTWDDVQTRPGFTTDIDPNRVQLKTIIGSYQFKDFISCGLSTCRQPHGRGYLVVTVDGRETNIGKDCGKVHFSVDFEDMRRAFDREVTRRDRRERLAALQHRVPRFEAEIARIRDSKNGANWVHKQISCLLSPGKGIPQEIIDRVKTLRQSRNGLLTIERSASEAERAALEASGQRGPHHSVTETVGRLEGASALYPENDLRVILVEKLGSVLSRLAEVDVDTLTDRQLAELVQKSSEIEPTIRQAEQVVRAGRQLLTKTNLNQLSRFLSIQADINVFGRFLRDLP